MDLLKSNLLEINMLVCKALVKIKLKFVIYTYLVM